MPWILASGHVETPSCLDEFTEFLQTRHFPVLMDSVTCDYPGTVFRISSHGEKSVLGINGRDHVMVVQLS